MTEELLPPAAVALMKPELVTAGLLYLVSDDAPSRVILDATAGGFSRTYIMETEGICLDPANCTPEQVAANWSAISDQAGQHHYETSGPQVLKFVGKAAAAAGLSLG